jgi:hypothetical protein
MKVGWLALLVIGSIGCASEPPPKPVAKPVATGPRCAPDADDMPKDAKPKMAYMQGAVRKCYQLNTGGGDSDVKVEVTVRESGEVRDVRVLGAAPHPSAADCLKKTLAGAKFAKFCGSDIAIRWTYALR